MRIDKSNNDDVDFNTIIEKYYQEIYKIAYVNVRSKADAEDITQTVFTKFYLHKKTYKCEEHLKACLIKATINQVKDYYKSAWKQRVEYFDEEIAESNNETDERCNIIPKLMDKLSPLYRTIIHLYYYEDMSAEQIGKVLHKTTSSIYTILNRAREKMKGYYQDGDF